LGKILEEIDRDLAERDVSPHVRQIHARICFSTRENISLPISRTPRGIENPHVKEMAIRIAGFIGNWYEEKYAELV